jgi:hypothetical protein
MMKSKKTASGDLGKLKVPPGMKADRRGKKLVPAKPARIAKKRAQVRSGKSS